MAKKNETAIDNDLASSSLTEGLNGETVEMMDFGIEGTKLTLSQIPILKLTQAMTPEVQDRNYKDIFAGMFINDTTKEAIGEVVEARVMRAWRCRAKFAPRESGSNAIECSCPTFMSPQDIGSEYGPCNKCMYNNFEMKEHCQTQYHLIVAINNDPRNLYRIILSKTSYKAGRKLDTGLQALGSRFRGNPVYMFKIRISAEEATNKAINSKYYVYKLEVINPVPGEPLLPEEIADEFKESFIEIAKLREDAINYHKNLVATKEQERESQATESAFDAMGESVTASFGITTDAPGGSEDIPF